MDRSLSRRGSDLGQDVHLGVAWLRVAQRRLGSEKVIAMGAHHELSTVRLSLAGALTLQSGDVTITASELGGRRVSLALAVMFIERASPVSGERLADILWPDDLPPTWASATRAAVSKVRAVLDRLGLGEECSIVTTAAGYEVHAGHGVQIVVDVEEAVDGAGRAAAALADGDVMGAIDLARACRPALARPALVGEDGPWATALREKQRDAHVACLETLAAARLALGQTTLAAATARDAIALAPLHESAHRSLMAAHAAGGNRGEALRAYELCRALLAEEMGVSPSAETEALYVQLLGDEPAPQAAPVALPGRLRFVGRHRALDTIGAAYDRCADGRGCVVLVSGDAGVGKTRLARETTELAIARGAEVLWGTCREPEWAPPFGAITDLLPALSRLASGEPLQRLEARLVDGGGHVPDSERARIREDLRRVLLGAAVAQPLVVVLDDLQWADAGTLDALRHVAPSLPSAPVLIVATVRDTITSTSAEASNAIAMLQRTEGCVRLDLSGLAVGEVHELIESVHPGTSPAVAESVHAQTGGNAFFVEALVLHLLQAHALLDADAVAGTRVPVTVRDVVGQRVDRLSPTSRDAMSAAALFEGPFTVAVLGAAAGLPEADVLDAIDEAIDARLIATTDRPDAYTVAHAIVQRTIAERIPATRRVRLHRAIATAIEECSPSIGVAEAAELAGQYHRSRTLPGAEPGIAHGVRAAAHAEAAGAPDRAATMLAMVLDLLPADDLRQVELTARRGLALIAAGRIADGATVALEVADGHLARGDARAAATLLADAAWAAEVGGSSTDAFNLASIGMPLVAEGPYDDIWARLYLLDLRRQEADSPERPGVATETPERRRAAEILHAEPRYRGDMAWGVWDRRTDIVARGGDDPWALTLWAGCFREALPIWQQHARAAETRGQVAEAVNAYAGAARCAVAFGHLADADEMTQHARSLADRIELRGSFALHLLGARDDLVHARADGLDELWRWSALLSSDRTDRTQRWAEAVWFAATARLFALDGQRQPALDMLSAATELIDAMPSWVVSTNRFVGDVVTAMWLLDVTDRLEHVTAAVRRALVEPDFRCPMTEPRLAHGRILGLAGDIAGARSRFDDARAVLAADGAQTLLPIVDHDEALLLVRAGQPAAAPPLLDRALDGFANLGMVGWARRAEDLLLTIA